MCSLVMRAFLPPPRRAFAKDRMLDMGFEPQIRKIIAGLPQDGACMHMFDQT